MPRAVSAPRTAITARSQSYRLPPFSATACSVQTKRSTRRRSLSAPAPSAFAWSPADGAHRPRAGSLYRRRAGGAPRAPELEVCACLGLLKDGQAERLAASGVHAYNHNLNTSGEHYSEICTTHTYEDRIDTLGRARAAGLSPCSGALLGMGQSNEDIVNVAFALRELQPDSVPINFLIPIEGTPLAGRNELTPWRCLRILALFRLIFPDVEVRIAGGRETHLRTFQPFGLLLANSVFAGDYLATRGQPAEADRRMIAELGLRIEGSAEPTLPKHRLEVELR